MSRLHEGINNFKEYLKRGGKVTVRRVVPISFGEKGYLSEKTVLITGGSSGIGLNLAGVLKNAGAKVIITGRDEKRLKNATLSLPGIETIQWDIRDVSNAEEKMRMAFSVYGKIDILINNAGIFDGTTVYDMSEDVFDRMIETNLKGTYFVSQAFLRNISDEDSEIKKIINILSIRSITSSTNMYCATKWAEKCFTEGLAKEMILKNKNVIVNGVAPGPTCSSINRINRINPEGNTYYAGGEKIKYMMIPEEITNVIAFLCTDMSNGIVGQTIVVDGGETIR